MHHSPFPQIPISNMIRNKLCVQREFQNFICSLKEMCSAESDRKPAFKFISVYLSQEEGRSRSFGLYFWAKSPLNTSSFPVSITLLMANWSFFESSAVTLKHSSWNLCKSPCKSLQGRFQQPQFRVKGSLCFHLAHWWCTRKRPPRHQLSQCVSDPLPE